MTTKTVKLLNEAELEALRHHVEERAKAPLQVRTGGGPSSAFKSYSLVEATNVWGAPRSSSGGGPGAPAVATRVRTRQAAEQQRALEAGTDDAVKGLWS